MTPQDRSQEVSRIYLAARELPDSDRLAYVERECAGDEALQRELESLLAWNSEAEPVMDALVRDAIAALPTVSVANTTPDQAERIHPAMDGTPGETGSAFTFDQVLLVEKDAGDVVAGAPFVANAKVVGVVDGEARGPKLRVFKKKRRKGFRKTRGHRSVLTRVRITEIQA